MAALYLAIVGSGLILIAAVFAMSALFSYRADGHGLFTGPALGVIAAVIIGLVGLIHFLAGIASWRRRMWGWWLGLLIFAIGFSGTLWLTVNAVQHLNDRFGTTPDAVAVFGVAATLFGLGLWAIASSRTWFSSGTAK